MGDRVLSQLLVEMDGLQVHASAFPSQVSRSLFKSLC